jgi:FlgD Ig-like domain
MKRFILLLVLLAMAAPSFSVWPPPIRLTDGPNQNINPFLSMQDYEYPIYDDVCLVWQRSRTGGWDIYSRMTNGLDTLWTSPDLVSSLADSNLTPAAANYGQHRYCVWVNCHQDSQNVLCSRWTGSAWGSPMYVTQDAFPNSGPTVWCHRTADTTWVAWASYRDNHWNLYSRVYNGSSWSPEIPVVENLGNNRSPRLFKLPFQNLSLVWQSDAYGNSDILLSRYQSGAWSAPIRVTTGPQSDVQPSPARGIAQPGGERYRVTLVWASDSLGNYEVWGTSADSLNAREQMTSHNATDNEPSCVEFFLIVKGLRINHPWLTAWTSDRDGNRNIYAEYWSRVDVVDTSSADDLHPQTAAVARVAGYLTLRFWIVWQSSRDGNWNLYGSNKLFVWEAVEENNASLREGKPKLAIRPTPYRPDAPLFLSLSQAGNEAVIAFYDLKGGLVSRQVAERKASGLYQATWDGRDASGKVLPSGLYFLRAEGSPNLFRLIMLR